MAHTVVLAGDIYIDRPQARGVLRGIEDVLADATFSCFNLEGPLTRTSQRFQYKPGKVVSSFRSDPEVGGELGAFTACSLANNHCMDCGPEGYLDTMETLDDVGIGHAGGGADIGRAWAPFVVRRDGLSVGLLAFTSVFQNGWNATPARAGMATVDVHTSYQPSPRVQEQPGSVPIVRTELDDESGRAVQEAIRELREQVDVVVVSFHWGVGKNPQVLEYQRALGHRSIDAGADVVFGHHPHLIQPLEVYRGRPILYSLGNLAFDRPSAWPCYQAALVRCHIAEDRHVESVGIVPLALPERAGQRNPELASRDVTEQVLRAFVGEDAMRRYHPQWTDAEVVIPLADRTEPPEVWR